MDAFESSKAARGAFLGASRIRIYASGMARSLSVGPELPASRICGLSNAFQSIGAGTGPAAVPPEQAVNDKRKTVETREHNFIGGIGRRYLARTLLVAEIDGHPNLLASRDAQLCLTRGESSGHIASGEEDESLVRRRRLDGLAPWFVPCYSPLSGMTMYRFVRICRCDPLRGDNPGGRDPPGGRSAVPVVTRPGARHRAKSQRGRLDCTGAGVEC